MASAESCRSRLRKPAPVMTVSDLLHRLWKTPLCETSLSEVQMTQLTQERKQPASDSAHILSLMQPKTCDWWAVLACVAVDVSTSLPRAPVLLICAGYFVLVLPSEPRKFTVMLHVIESLH